MHACHAVLFRGEDSVETASTRNNPTSPWRRSILPTASPAPSCEPHPCVRPAVRTFVRRHSLGQPCGPLPPRRPTPRPHPCSNHTAVWGWPTDLCLSHVLLQLRGAAHGATLGAGIPHRVAGELERRACHAVDRMYHDGLSLDQEAAAA
jgi:hypothetical protein